MSEHTTSPSHTSFSPTQKKLLIAGVAVTLILSASVATLAYQIYQTKALLTQERDALHAKMAQLGRFLN